MPQAFVDEIDTPVGPLVLCASEQGLSRIEFGAYEQVEPSLKAWTRKMLLTDTLVPDKFVLHESVKQLGEYFDSGRVAFRLPIDLRGTAFQVRVWQALRDVPFGKTRSYLQIGQAIGSPKAVRAVGGANNRNPLPIIIPCHRIIGADGSLVGYGGGISIKRKLLELEGWSG